MPFLFEIKGSSGRWHPAATADTWESAQKVIANVEKRGSIPSDCIRVSETDQARIDWRFARDHADEAFREYNRLNAEAYDLMIKIRPR